MNPRFVMHLRGLKANIQRLRDEFDRMNGPAYCPPNACCPSCFWGERYTEVSEALERREHYLRVLMCRARGLRPRKVKIVKIPQTVPCAACNGKGRTTVFSIGRCYCGERNCPGRGRCHACGGSGRTQVWKEKQIVVRPWPKEAA